MSKKSKTLCIKCKHSKGMFIYPMCGSPKIEYYNKQYSMIDGKLLFAFYKTKDGNARYTSGRFADCLDVNDGNCSLYKKEKSRVKRLLKKLFSLSF